MGEDQLSHGTTETDMIWPMLILIKVPRAIAGHSLQRRPLKHGSMTLCIVEDHLLDLNTSLMMRATQTAAVLSSVGGTTSTYHRHLSSESQELFHVFGKTDTSVAIIFVVGQKPGGSLSKSKQSQKKKYGLDKMRGSQDAREGVYFDLLTIKSAYLTYVDGLFKHGTCQYDLPR